jgi:hypothetical protein
MCGLTPSGIARDGRFDRRRFVIRDAVNAVAFCHVHDGLVITVGHRPFRLLVDPCGRLSQVPASGSGQVSRAR